MSRKIEKLLQERMEERRAIQEDVIVEDIDFIMNSLNDLAEGTSNASVEEVIKKLRSQYRANELMTFRQWLNVFAKIIG